MWQHYLTAILFMAVLTGSWLGVQRLWRRYVPEGGPAADDALANHGGCHGCTCHEKGCERDDISN
jgi:hypothetical protein